MAALFFFVTHTQDLFTEISQNVRGAGWGEMLHRGIEATGFVLHQLIPNPEAPSTGPNVNLLDNSKKRSEST